MQKSKGNNHVLHRIDISKSKHDCAVIDDVGMLSLPRGHLQKALLDSLGSKTRIGLESTGHYGTNLKLFLESCSTTVLGFNPLLINRFVKSKFLRKTNADSIDCEMITRYLMT